MQIFFRPAIGSPALAGIGPKSGLQQERSAGFPRSAREIFGTPDDLKLRSCVTLFAEVSPAGSVFHCLIQVYFGGAPDGRTLTLGQTADQA